MRYGYVSLDRYDAARIERYRTILQERSCELVLMDIGSEKRPNLESLLNSLRAADQIVAVKLSHLAASPNDLAYILHEIAERNATFTAIEDGFSSNSAVARELVSICEKLRQEGRHESFAGASPPD